MIDFEGLVSFHQLGDRQTVETIRMIEKLPSPTNKAIGFRLSGRLHDEDYKEFVPLVDEAIAG